MHEKTTKRALNLLEATAAEAPEPQASQPSEPSQAEAKPKSAQQPPSQPEAVEEALEARDYTQVPKQLDEAIREARPRPLTALYEESSTICRDWTLASLAQDSSLRPTIINPGSTWSKRSQAALLLGFHICCLLWAPSPFLPNHPFLEWPKVPLDLACSGWPLPRRVL